MESRGWKPIDPANSRNFGQETVEEDQFGEGGEVEKEIVDEERVDVLGTRNCSGNIFRYKEAVWKGNKTNHEWWKPQ